MTARARHLLGALLAGAALAGAGCGGSSEEEPDAGQGLPQSTVDQLDNRLREVQDRYQAGVDEGLTGACDDLASDSFGGAGGIDELIAGLPEDVDPELRQAVERSFTNLRELTDDCNEKAEAAAEPEVEPEPVPVEPEPEETTPETTPEEEPEEGGGNGNGGGSNGNGGGQPAPDPAPAPEPAPEPQQPDAVPPGEGGGVPAPAPRGQQGSEKDKSSKKKGGKRR